MIETRGVIPEITDDEEKMEWLNIIEKSVRSSEDELEPYMKEYGGPLIGFGVDYEGYLFVEFDKNVEDTINKSTIDELYNIIEDDARKIELSDVPVVFEKGEGETLESRFDLWTNLIGGIQLVGGGQQSTLSFAAKDSSGTKGFVMSAHAAVAAGGIGGDIYQGGRKVGDVELYNGVFADAAWVEASNVVDDIYYQDTDQLKDVANYGDTTYGQSVYKSGIATGLTSGTVTRTYVEQDSPTFGTLYDQFSASYSSAGGDSGSPVFKVSGDTVKIVGVHRGRWSDDAAFSPINGVIQDLAVTPLTT